MKLRIFGMLGGLSLVIVSFFVSCSSNNSPTTTTTYSNGNTPTTASIYYTITASYCTTQNFEISTPTGYLSYSNTAVPWTSSTYTFTEGGTYSPYVIAYGCYTGTVTVSIYKNGSFWASNTSIPGAGVYESGTL